MAKAYWIDTFRSIGDPERLGTASSLPVAAYESAGYREALAALSDAAVRDERIVEALTAD